MGLNVFRERDTRKEKEESALNADAKSPNGGFLFSPSVLLLFAEKPSPRQKVVD